MDEPCWAWPFWKFGLKRDDLNTTLHDRFNTVPLAIQDPEAFHHDVYELSTQACTLDEFERLMEERKKLRLEELNGMLENASFEIVGNPSLIGTEQWQYALQLFRTKSLDSLVRYFASYLPQDHPWHYDIDSGVSSTCHDSVLDCDSPFMFDEPEEDDYLSTNEPSHPCSATGVSSDLLTRSMTVRSEDSGVSVTDRDQHKPHDNLTSERAMTFFESDPAHTISSLDESIPSLHEYEGTSQSDDPETPSTSISDLSDVDEPHGKDMMVPPTIADDDGYISISHTQSQTINSMVSVPTPNPKPAGSATSPATAFFNPKLSSLRSPGLSSNYSHPHYAHDTNKNYRKPHSTTRLLRRRFCGLDRKRRCGSRSISKTHKICPRSRERGI